MHIAILTFPGFNELDSLIALGPLSRIKQPGWRVSLACPVGEKEAYVARALAHIHRYLPK